MKLIKLIIFCIALCLLGSIGYGQSYIPFATGRTTDTARTTGSLLVPFYVRLPIYGSSDSDKVLGVMPNGMLVLRTKGSGGADSAVFATRYWVTTNFAPISGSGNYIQNNITTYQNAGFMIYLNSVIGNDIFTEDRRRKFNVYSDTTDPVNDDVTGIYTVTRSAYTAGDSTRALVVVGHNVSTQIKSTNTADWYPTSFGHPNIYGVLSQVIPQAGATGIVPFTTCFTSSYNSATNFTIDRAAGFRSSVGHTGTTNYYASFMSEDNDNGALGTCVLGSWYGSSGSIQYPGFYGLQLRSSDGVGNSVNTRSYIDHPLILGRDTTFHASYGLTVDKRVRLIDDTSKIIIGSSSIPSEIDAFDGRLVSVINTKDSANIQITASYAQNTLGNEMYFYGFQGVRNAPEATRKNKNLFIFHAGGYDGSATVIQGRLQFRSGTAVTGSNASGEFLISTKVNTSLSERFKIDSTGREYMYNTSGLSIANDGLYDGSNRELIVKGQAQITDSLLVGGPVGIGTSTPTELLHLSGAVNGNVRLRVDNTTNGTSSLAGMYVSNGAKGFAVSYFPSGYTVVPAVADAGVLRVDGAVSGGLFIRTGGATSIKLGTNDVDRMTIADAQITSSVAVGVPDDAFSSTWNASTNVPTKNAVYDLGTNSIRSAAGTLGLSYGADYTFTGTTTTWTLPALNANSKGRWYMITIKNAGSGAITLNSNAGGNDIYSTALTNTFTINAGESYIIMPDGTQLNIE